MAYCSQICMQVLCMRLHHRCVAGHLLQETGISRRSNRILSYWALADQERKILGAVRVLTTEGINPPAVQAFKIVGVFLPTERAEHQ